MFVFFALWGVLFVAGLLLGVKAGVESLAPVSLADSVLLLAVAYGIAGVTKRGIERKIIGLILILIIVGFVYQNPSYITSTQPFREIIGLQASYLTSITTAILNGFPAQRPAQSSPVVSESIGDSGEGSTSTSSMVSHVINPLIVDNEANITYPVDYQQLAGYALTLINEDRASNGLSAVTLSNGTSAQQHADSMLYYDYFSHWDTQGYSPYMRYSLLGGDGAVAENIGRDACTSSPGNATLLSVVPCTIQTIEGGINNSEWGMMYNDASCCNNGHRENILDPLHNRVSIGIAYNTSSSTLYFVEDFENDYITLNGPIQNGGNLVDVTGTTANPQNISTIAVYFDPLPQSLTPSQLDSTSDYGPGTFVGGIFPPCLADCQYYPGAVTVYASSWLVGTGSISIAFSLDDFLKADGPGVYTIYVQTGNSTADAILMHSFFLSS